MIFVCLSRFISSKKSLFFNLGTLKAPLEPKLFQTAPNGLIHLNLCFGRALSQKRDLVYEFRSFFSIFSFWLSFWGIFFANYTPFKVPQIFFLPPYGPWLLMLLSVSGFSSKTELIYYLFSPRLIFFLKILLFGIFGPQNSHG